MTSTRDRLFPVLVDPWDPRPTSPKRIPWEVAERAYSGYTARYGKYQSLERIAERGGFGARELDMWAPGWDREAK